MSSGALWADFGFNLLMDNSKLLTQNSKLPQPPWTLTGNAALLLSKSGGVALVHYESSPVGSYNEWARGVWTPRGPRVVEMAVTSEDSKRAGRENWGFPKQLESLCWQQHGAHIEFRRDAEIYRLRACGPQFLFRVQFFCVQTLNDQEVRVPFRIEGKARMAWRGRQIALLLHDFVFDVEAPQLIK